MSFEQEKETLDECKEDIWSTSCDWICITTNGVLNSKDCAVMGKGLALQAKEKVKGCEKILGHKIKQFGNHVYIFANYGITQKLVSFPTKHHWKDKSDLKLIDQSCRELLSLWKLQPKKNRVCLTKVGCLNGGLNYDVDVRPILTKYFGDAECRPWFKICI